MSASSGVTALLPKIWLQPATASADVNQTHRVSAFHALMAADRGMVRARDTTSRDAGCGPLHAAKPYGRLTAPGLRHSAASGQVAMPTRFASTSSASAFVAPWS